VTKTSWLAQTAARTLQAAVCAGDIDSVVGLRTPLRALLETNSLKGSERLVAMVAGSALHLVKLEKEAAAACLAPYVTYATGQGTVTVHERALDHLCEKAPSLLAGLVCAEIANLLHRTWDPKRGAKVGHRALGLFESGGKPLNVPLDPLFCELLQCLAVAWWARLAWQTGESAEALRRLETLRLRMARLRGDYPDRVSGIDLVTAITLDLIADLCSLKGEHGRALNAANEAWLLLTCGNNRDAVRSGHVLYTMGKVIATRVTPEDYYLPVLVLEKAEHTYPNDHPLVLRAANRKARCYLRGHQLAKARTALRDARKALVPGSLPPDEERYCQAEMLLTELLISEHEALSDRTRASACIEGGKALLGAARGVTPRLQVEAHLHLAIAQIRYGERGIGLRHLDEATRLLATDEGPITARIGIILARTEAILAHDREAARRHWLEATRLLSSVQSAFLREWRDRLAAQLEAAITVTLDPDASYAEAQKASKRAYVQYQLQRFNYNLPKVAAAIRVSRPHLYEVLKGLGIEIRPEKGGPTQG
jgi:hypothetical protein